MLLNKRPEIDPAVFRIKAAIKHSPVHRWGVFAGQDIPAGRMIAEYNGQFLSRKAVKDATDKGAMGTYWMWVDSYRTVDGASGGGAQCINHCCEPNVKIRIRNRRPYIWSAKAIKAGEELLLDYNLAGDYPIRCECGTPKCRGYMNEESYARRLTAAA